MVRVNQSYNKEQKDEDSPIINTTLLLGSFLMLLLLSLIVVPPISISHIALANTGKSSHSRGGGRDNGNTDGSSSGSTSDTLTKGGSTDDNNNGGVASTDTSTNRIRLADIEVVPSSIRAQEIYLNIVKSAAEEILWIFPTANAFICQEKIGVIKLAKQATKQRNVKVRIMVPTNPLIEQKIQQLNEYCPDRVLDVRYIEQMTETKATILVVDRKASLVMELRDDSKTTFFEAIGLSTYSNSKAGVLSYVAMFENFWKQSELYQEIKESHDQLKIANEKLRMQDKIQNDFIKIAAHELRNPVQPILGMSQIVKSMITQKKEVNIHQTCDHLNVIIRNARKLQRLTDDILDINRIETNSLHIRKETFNLKELIQVLVDDYKSPNNNEKKYGSNIYRNIELSCLLPSITEEAQNADPFLIEADRDRISQVISNLLSNAFKFTNQDDTIHVTIEKKDTGSIGEVTVSIKDTGTGINPEIFPRLFTKFATKSDGGTGLGLFICKSIVEAHGGKIWAKNNSDGEKGATFAFNIPLAFLQDHHQESITINTVPAMINDTDERIKKKRDDYSGYYNSHKTKMKRIFLVDDNYDHTVTFKVGLELAGFEVDAYNDSEIALSKFKPDYYDLMLIDIKMPKIDGFELYEKISERDNKVKVWFITAYDRYDKASKEVPPKSREMILKVVEKPIEIDILVKQIKSELD
ncbi:MAG: hybrid sensor histidine kinase/response regulator [Nitrososphaeraceae archaeon]